MTIRHLTRKVTAKNAESTTQLATIAGSGFHTKGEMMSEEGFPMTTPLDTLHEDYKLGHFELMGGLVMCPSCRDRNIEANAIERTKTGIAGEIREFSRWAKGSVGFPLIFETYEAAELLIRAVLDYKEIIEGRRHD
jgi:hypothetical protein